MQSDKLCGSSSSKFIFRHEENKPRRILRKKEKDVEIRKNCRIGTKQLTSESIRREKNMKSERFRIRVRVMTRRTGATRIDKSKKNYEEKNQSKIR